MISDVNILNGYLQIIDNFYYKFGKISLLIFFCFLSFLNEICQNLFAVFLYLFFPSLDNFCVFAIPLGMRELSYHNLETLEKYLYFAGRQGFPRNVHFKTSKSTKSENEWEVEFLHYFFFESYVPEDNLSRPNSYVQVIRSKILDILSQNLIEKPFY